MALTDTSARQAKPGDKPYKLYDEKGLFLEVTPRGSKYWRYKYRFAGKEKLLALGVYPEVTLKEAREALLEARKKLKDGIDPAEDRKEKKQALKEEAAREYDTYERIGREWHEKNSPKWSERHSLRLLQRLERDIFPHIGKRPIAEIEAPEILAMLRMVEGRGFIESEHRVHNLTGQVFRYAISIGKAKRDPSADLRGALPPVVVTHRASITNPKEVGALLRTIEGYQGYSITRYALLLAPLVFVRPGELRSAEWKEIDFEKAEWRIPATRMKMRVVHLVPLSTQALTILEQLKILTGSGKYLFPGARSADRVMSENTVNAALRRLSYTKEEMTGHGFRSMASTLLNELGFNPDAIERQLAHAERDGVRAAYNYADYLPERRRMMQAWADYLDQLKINQ